MVAQKGLLKWAGGKEQELKYILPYVPDFNRYYEPFVGGGAACFSIPAKQSFLNDASQELMALYQVLAENNLNFWSVLSELTMRWEQLTQVIAQQQVLFFSYYQNGDLEMVLREQSLLDCFFCADESARQELRRNLKSKLSRMKRLEAERGKLSSADVLANLECACKSAFYMHIRALYNTHAMRSRGAHTALFFFVREYAYASMFRYNKKGHLNVPYGGISYNQKSLAKKVSYLHAVQDRVQDATLACMDFEAFLEMYPPADDDFLLVDPPYDTHFSTYSKNIFGKDDQIRLARVLQSTKGKFLLLAKNTPLIRSLYGGYHLFSFEKNYLVNFQGRNNKKTEHTIITNYTS